MGPSVGSVAVPCGVLVWRPSGLYLIPAQKL